MKALDITALVSPLDWEESRRMGRGAKYMVDPLIEGGTTTVSLAIQGVLMAEHPGAEDAAVSPGLTTLLRRPRPS